MRVLLVGGFGVGLFAERGCLCTRLFTATQR